MVDDGGWVVFVAFVVSWVMLGLLSFGSCDTRLPKASVVRVCECHVCDDFDGYVLSDEPTKEGNE